MPRNSQGLYTLPAGNPVVPNTLIEANWANPTMDDIAAALTGSLPRDGSAPMTGPLTLNGAPPSSARHATSKAYVDQFLAFASGLPIGAVTAYAGATVPSGYLECNGQAVSRTTYVDLFTALGTTYGAGDASTTFNVPDMRDEFIRGKSDTRALGNKQAGSFASHVHPLTDPGHTHGASQTVHGHVLNAHGHAITDPGHAHDISGSVTGGEPGTGVGVVSGSSTTGGKYTGVGVVAVGDFGMSSAQPPVTVTASTTGEIIGAAGGAETVPQNIAQIYIIKAVNDSAGPVGLTGIDTSDAQMISVDNTNPVIPLLDIQSNVAFGTVKLDASGKVPLNQMPTSSSQFLGYFDASSSVLPIGTFNSGDYYAVSVQGTLTVYNPVTLTAAPTLVVVGSQLHYVTGSLTNPTGWYTLTVSGATLASDVQFIPSGTISGTNVQLAISELDSETQTALGGKAPSAASTGAGTSFPASGSISATNVTAAIQELDTETVKLVGGTMAGQLKGITPVDAEDLTRKDYVDDLARGPAFSAYQSTAQATISANVNTKVLFQTKEYDTNTDYSVGNSRFTPTVAGYYQINGAINVSGSTGIGLNIYKNGAQAKNGMWGSTGIATCSAVLYLNGSTDYVELWVFSAVSGQPLANAFSTYFQGTLVRAE
jgi:microcystin-dependent protein